MTQPDHYVTQIVILTVLPKNILSYALVKQEYFARILSFEKTEKLAKKHLSHCFN